MVEVGLGVRDLLSGFGARRIVQCQNDLAITLKQIPAFQNGKNAQPDPIPW
jgi:hypothetical protein